MKGFIHSRESFGTVDGPGLRYVLFLQGCPMRCLYCHNPDTWRLNEGEQVEPEQVISEFEKNREFYEKGGITVTGGEPLLQIEFVTELFRLAKKKSIHTCIDTSGITYREDSPEVTARFDELMRYTDLVMLDIKHVDPQQHKRLTGQRLDNVLAFAKYLERKQVKLWVRHVIIKGYTDGEAELTRLGEFLASLQNLVAVDALPYHTLGKEKYRELGIDYPLEGVPQTSKEEAHRAKQIILKAILNTRKAKSGK